jgi:GrpB-like predicted nucleotidyltransferase (UPF0157 family)
MPQQRASRPDRPWREEGVVVVAHDPSWVLEFRSVAGRLRAELGDVALRIDHIGSTAIAGLDAKPVVDIQISVRSFEPFDDLRVPIERAGFVHRADNTERTKRYFRERPGDRRTHIHVRRAGSFSEQLALLFRDYLRAHPADAERYGALKRELAARHAGPDERHLYVTAKVPFTWETIHRADDWAQATGWEPPPSDA